ncbi:hypothetical protein BASA50_009684 [Batrachochytrium salamandrivorans]|uniref:Calcium-transporting ATPase n=1 Tax=Batrachochytrium salamandrivorans TaxID=1357716 RepID=A0ABQ8F0L0_9FUNG|nr:hypothetical protein BASA62_010431 [Batrachochytrium salamandrivorans]KAH6581943.1 hypothetical protein BASA61_008831 [Batrachochytrium salamandrivorans]KAH6589983.1 hypothetical protein BASA50_009684 [Batrachochytrium salamandrivorans]
MVNNSRQLGYSPYGLTSVELSRICDFDRRGDPALLNELQGKYGGVKGIAKSLRTDITLGLLLKSKFHELQKLSDKPSREQGHLSTPKDASESSGLSVYDEAVRRAAFGENIIPPPNSESIIEIVWHTIVEDPILKILIVGAVVVLSLSSATCPSSGWIEGFAIVLAVLIVLSVTAGNDWSKDRRFKKLLLLQTDKRCRVLRSGIRSEISSWDILVGDVIELVAGDEIPADGVFISGNRLVVDESPLTGESMPCKKSTSSPFLFSGCHANEGIGLMLVLSIGVRSSGGKIQTILNEAQNKETPLQAKLKVVAIYIGKIGVAAGIITFIGLAIRWAILLANNLPVTLDACSDHGNSGYSTIDRVQSLVSEFVVAITIVVVAVPEGLPLAVTLALSLSMFKMMKDKCFVRHLDASETMGQATTICTDKTGTLTYNRMSVVRVFIDGHTYKGEGSGDKEAIAFSPKTFNPAVKTLLCEGISVNSTCFIKDYDQLEDNNTQPQFIGSATEGALLMLVRKLGEKYAQIRKNILIVEEGVWAFNADRKRMSTLVYLPESQLHRLYTKGASEIILSLCTQILDTEKMVPTNIKHSDIQNIEKTIMTWAAEGLRTLALAYKDVNNIEEINQQEDPDSDLIFIALVAIKDPIRKEIPKAVKDCQHAGLFVRMVTGDNILTATKIAKECGIFYGDGVALEGAAFRNMSEEERIKILPQLQVLARCSPNDKFELVSLLRQQGEVVAVTGDGTNDAPALKNADIGFSMGISGTQIALNASDIVLLDDNFTSIVQAIRWGRNVLNTIQKFLQFQLGINLAAIIITFAGAVFVGKSPFSTVQLLWVNLIMDSFGALALASDDPDDDILDKPPHHRKDSIFSYFMLEYIFTQTIYQVTTLLVILFNIDTFVPASTNTHSTQDLIGYPSKRARTIVFTTFICMQITNLICARQLNNDLNLFSGFFRNRIFIGILAIILLIQIVAVTVGSTLFNASSLDITEWIVCIIISLFNLPIVFLARMGSKIYHVTAARQKYGRVGDAKVLNGVTPSKQVDTIDGKKQYDRVAYVEHIDKTAEDLDLLDYSESPLRGEVDLERGLATRPLKTNQGKQRLSDKTTNNGKSVSSQNNENVEVMHSIHVNAPLSTKSRSVASSISVISTGSQEL